MLKPWVCVANPFKRDTLAAGLGVQIGWVVLYVASLRGAFALHRLKQEP